ncbi:MAG: hypothetical protein AVDCRST_MAG08-2409, partial [uncultured Acetobacteraceae bacterium]
DEAAAAAFPIAGARCRRGGAGGVPGGRPVGPRDRGQHRLHRRRPAGVRRHRRAHRTGRRRDSGGGARPDPAGGGAAQGPGARRHLGERPRRALLRRAGFLRHRRHPPGLANPSGAGAAEQRPRPGRAAARQHRRPQPAFPRRASRPGEGVRPLAGGRGDRGDRRQPPVPRAGAAARRRAHRRLPGGGAAGPLTAHPHAAGNGVPRGPCRRSRPHRHRRGSPAAGLRCRLRAARRLRRLVRQRPVPEGL